MITSSSKSKEDIIVSSNGEGCTRMAAKGLKLLISCYMAVLFLVGGIQALISITLDAVHAMEATSQVSFEAMVGNHPIRMIAMVLQMGLVIEVLSRSIAALTHVEAKPTRRTLRWSLGGFCLLMTIPVIPIVGSNTESHQESPYTFLPKDKYYYPGTSTNATLPDQSTLNLADYVFLSTSVYTRDQEFPTLLEGWFGKGKAVDGTDLLREFRQREDPHNKIPVGLKVVLFPKGDTAVVVVRGVQNYWDVLESLNLWATPVLLRFVHWFFPVPQVLATRLLTRTNRPSSYLHLTTRLVEELKTQYSTVHVTGHSLGGGLAMLTGAQARVPAVGVSAPSCRGATQARGLESDLDQWTLNIVPDKDWVPKIDRSSSSEEPNNIVNLRCTSNNPFGCHPGRRSLCEVLYTEGSRDRPIPRECVSQRGYPMPSRQYWVDEIKMPGARTFFATKHLD